MSTAKKPRAVKPKTVKKETPEPPVEVPVPAPAVVATPAPVAPPAATKPPAATETQEKPPIVTTSTSRVTTNLNVFGINALLKARHSELDDKIKSFEHAKAALASGKLTDTREVDKVEGGATTKVKESYERALTADESASFKKTVEQHSHSISSMEADRHAYGSACLRFAKNTANAVAVVCDEIVKQVFNHAMAAGLKDDKKHISVEHMYSEGIDKLPLAPLFNTLPTFTETFNALTTERRAKDEKTAREVLLKNHDKELRRTYKITKKMAESAGKTAPAPAPAAAPEEDEKESSDPEEHEPVDRKRSFNHYAGNLCKTESALKYPGQKLHATGKLRDHLAKLISDYCRRLCTLLAESVKYDDSKTVQVETVLFVLKLLLVDGHKPVETVELQNVDVPNPDVLKKEQEKKAAEKKAGRSYKIDMSKIPNVIGRKAVHTVTYPTSGYDALEKVIKSKLAEFDAEEDAKKAPAK